jgi:hypothetical protein
MKGEMDLSDDGLYRFWLRCEWGDGPTVTWVMFNPSHAGVGISSDIPLTVLAAE